MRDVSAGDIKEAALCRLLAKQARADAISATTPERRRACRIAAIDFDGIADTLDSPPNSGG